MIRAALGRFMRHCIACSAVADTTRVRVHEFDPEFMSDAEISAFIHARPVDWEMVEIRRSTGCRMRPAPLPGPIAAVAGAVAR